MRPACTKYIGISAGICLLFPRFLALTALQRPEGHRPRAQAPHHHDRVVKRAPLAATLARGPAGRGGRRAARRGGPSVAAAGRRI